MNSGSRKVVIIAGPNGAGKTTFALEFLPNEASCPTFVNADLIASGLSPFDPGPAALRAGRIMVREIGLHVRNGDNFAFETTLSGRMYARLIPEWQRDKYSVKLVFLKLASPELAIARVAKRVAQGGHDIAEDVIRRRFASGWQNFTELYRPLVDRWVLYDNSEERAILVDAGGKE